MKLRKLKFLPTCDEEWLIPKEALIATAICEEVNGKPLRILEVGLLNGAYLLNLGKNVLDSELWAIDPYPNLENMRLRTLRRFKGFNFTLVSSWNDLPELLFNYIHIDGLHTYEGIIVDLENSIKFLDETGVLVVDDIFNSFFPGVPAGFFSWLVRSDFAIFLTTGSKAFLTRKKFHGHWFNVTRDAFNEQNEIKFFKYFGDNVDALAYISNTQIEGYEMILSVERFSPNPNYKLLPNFPSQPNYVAPQSRD